MDGSLSAQELSELIGLIYDAAIEPSRWPLAMEAIRTGLDFANSTFNLQLLPSGDVVINVTSNIPPPYVALMADAGPDVVELWGGEQVMRTWPLCEPAIWTRVNPRFHPKTTTNRYYLDFAKPQGIVDTLAVGLARDARALGSIAFGRHESAGPIGEPEIEAARLLVPHLQRAATINRLLDVAALARATFAAVLDTLTVPIVLASASLRIAHANPAARRLLDRGDLIHARGGVLGSVTTGASSALAAAISHADHDESAIGRRGLGIPVRRPDGSSAALHVLPLRRGRAALDTGAVAAVFVAQVDTPLVAPTEVVAALFDLTPAEARVFGRIAACSTVEETADALGVERSTVKTHLLRLYAKIGVRRQAELVQVAASLAVPVGAWP